MHHQHFRPSPINSIVSLCHQGNKALTSQCRFWQSYPRIMDSSRKRQRSFDEGSEFGALASLSRPISPPRKRFRQVVQKSPWQLTRIRDVPEESNKDTVTLEDILGDPSITECWQFNFLHDIPFVMDAFDQRIRDSVQLHVVHGFWKRNDLNRVVLSVCGRCLTIRPPGCRDTLGSFTSCLFFRYLFLLFPMTRLQFNELYHSECIVELRLMSPRIFTLI